LQPSRWTAFRLTDRSLTLAQWLDHVERLHSRPIDLGLQRVREVAQRANIALQCTTIVVAGTNGKGSTCATLEAILLQAGYRVGCYTSPHLLRFNERARIDGRPVEDAALLPHFEAIEHARGETTLTYFEFTTLAILRLFAGMPLDVAILEVGLGGRLDAVNIVDADCAILTSVDIDHAEHLGDTREAIGAEKAHVFRPGRPAICADPMPPDTVIAHARAIGADLWRIGQDFSFDGDRQQWSYRGREQRRASLAFPALRGANQLLNAAGALAALESLRTTLPVTQQAVRQGLALVELPGRFQVLPGRPTVILDVAHNPHAAAHLARNLDAMGFFLRTWAVFGMLRDKDVAGTVRQLGKRIDCWLCIDLPGPRGASAEALAQCIEQTGVAAGSKHTVERHRDARGALASAKERADENDRIVVFGSFLTVADALAAGAAPNR
jgi:dihydrofolate synthase / folylpolyglutamate synthase